MIPKKNIINKENYKNKKLKDEKEIDKALLIKNNMTLEEISKITKLSIEELNNLNEK